VEGNRDGVKRAASDFISLMVLKPAEEENQAIRRQNGKGREQEPTDRRSADDLGG